MVPPWLFLVGALAGQPSEEPAPLAARLGRNGRAITVSFDVTNTFTESFRKRLNGGITSTVEIQMQLLDKDEEVVASATRRCKLRLDIWDDVLLVRISDNDDVTRRRFIVVDDGLRSCGLLNGIPIADRALLTSAGGYRLVAAVALNPVDPELIERSREFSSNPRGTAGRPRSLLGGFARLFHGKPTGGGETFLFRSQILFAPTGAN